MLTNLLTRRCGKDRQHAIKGAANSMLNCFFILHHRVYSKRKDLTVFCFCRNNWIQVLQARLFS